nr:hypothetical protein [Chromatium okenii]
MPNLPNVLYPLTFPLRLVPGVMHSHALATMLNQVMKEAIVEGELDFLQGRRVAIEIDDIGVRYLLGLTNGHIQGYGNDAPADASISGGLRNFYCWQRVVRTQIHYFFSGVYACQVTPNWAYI